MRKLITAAALAAELACTRDPPAVAARPPPKPGELLRGKAAYGDWTADAPLVRRKLAVADLPPPYATDSFDNGPRIVSRPAGARPQVPPGFAVDLFAAKLDNPRVVRTAPNGDVFVVESRSGRVRVLRDADGDGRAELDSIFATGLRQPFGLAFHPLGAEPRWVYVANTDSVVRLPYHAGDRVASGPAEVVVGNISSGGLLRGGGHWSRDIVFAKDGTRLYASVGSFSNVDDDEAEARRARIFEYTPDGKNERVYATGIRNPVGLAVHPETGDLWTSVNERDGLGDDLVPDYVTRVKDGGFYGWPWYYLGAHPDPRHRGKHPELAAEVIVPDVLVQAHSASLAMTFYTGSMFPENYRGGAFAAEHGSWNRARRTGYKLIFVPTEHGVPNGEYVDFMTGFVVDDGHVWGRPVGVTEAKDGALIVSDDGANCLWRITYARP